MSHALRSIAFVAELIHQPARHEPKVLQKLHSELFGDAAASYRDFRLIPGGAQLSNTAATALPGQPVSCANILADRVQVREEQTGTSRDDFRSRTDEIARACLGNVPGEVFLAQQFTVRSVVNLHTSEDSRSFMLGGLFGFEPTQLVGFPGEPSLAGMRFTFGPDASAGGGIFNVRIESFAQDNRSLFLETIGTWPKPVNEEALGALAERFDATYAFQEEKLVAFVSQFDSEGEA